MASPWVGCGADSLQQVFTVCVGGVIGVGSKNVYFNARTYLIIRLEYSMLMNVFSAYDSCKLLAREVRRSKVLRPEPRWHHGLRMTSPTAHGS